MSAFAEIAKGRPARLIVAALDFAADEYPDLDPDAYIEQLQAFAEGFEIYLGSGRTDRDILSRLNSYFFEELGFTGNTNEYYDPRNSYINDVIDRRAGIPISLSVIYQDLARSVGVPLFGVNLPGHFMLCHESAAGYRLYIDVFNRGQWLEWSECEERLRDYAGASESLDEDDYPAMTDRDVLVRMLRNLKGIYSRCDISRCLRIQERIVQLLPEEPLERRDLGVLYYHNAKPMHAVKTLEGLLRDHPTFSERESAENYLVKATREAVLLN